VFSGPFLIIHHLALAFSAVDLNVLIRHLNLFQLRAEALFK
jgi:hypothetical protein